MPAKRKLPSFVCSTCGKRRPVKGRIHSRYTGRYFCAKCIVEEIKKPVQP